MDAGITLNKQPEEYRLLTCFVSEGLWDNAINKWQNKVQGWSVDRLQELSLAHLWRLLWYHLNNSLHLTQGNKERRSY